MPRISHTPFPPLFQCTLQRVHPLALYFQLRSPTVGLFAKPLYRFQVAAGFVAKVALDIIGTWEKQLP
jgi:hypothetical protein